jgi:predicted Rossmann fold flavoprotein
MNVDIVIIGAGAAGMMCAAQAGYRGKQVLVIDHADKPGEKIRISGGGRCNFTNSHCSPKNFLSENPHFCKSALSRYRPKDFIELVDRYNIAWHEKSKGQLFCDGKSQQIIDMLIAEMDNAGAELWLGTDILDIRRGETGFIVTTSRQSIACDNLVMACGGASIPKMGATNFGYKIAGQFGLNVIDPVPALVPLTFTDQLKEPLKALAGVSTNSVVSHGKTAFEEALLFTHRGLSGPSILQISSYWAPGDMITLDMAPGVPMFERLKTAREHTPRQSPQVFLSHYLPSRLAQMIASGQKSERLADMSDTALRNLALMINSWMVKPAGSEGFRTAEVTKGGVDTQELSSKTMEAKAVPGLYFIGEVVDVTGHLGGHNFQWAWASAVACGDAL